MKKSIWLLSLLLIVAIYSGCGEKDDPASNRSVTTNAYPSPSDTPTPTATPFLDDSNADNSNTPGGKPVPPVTPTPKPTATPKPTPRPTVDPEERKIVKCSCYDQKTGALLWKRTISMAECKRLCPLDYHPTIP
jgi:hypothetical protein